MIGVERQTGRGRGVGVGGIGGGGGGTQQNATVLISFLAAGGGQLLPQPGTEPNTPGLVLLLREGKAINPEAGRKKESEELFLISRLRKT